jgi:uncharacterized membrane protein YdjX (TVP38/TMEM64 family)
MSQPSTQGQALREGLRRGAILAGLAALVACLLLAWYYWTPIWSYCLDWWAVLNDKEAFRQRIQSYGAWGPVVFIVFQISQVFIAPIPGELVGAVGGYIFGWLPSTAYSTIGLTVGSCINFAVARILGKAFVEKVIPPNYMSKFAFLMERQGMLAAFIFFVVPGFPKDLLCYVLGLAPMSWRVFLAVSTIGRIPGTFMLSIQGSLVYQEDYWSFLWVGLLSVAFIAPVYFWRERIYQFLYRLDKGRGPLADEQPPSPPQP